MTSKNNAPTWLDRIYSEAAEQRRDRYLPRVMRGEIRIEGVPVLPGFASAKD